MRGQLHLIQHDLAEPWDWVCDAAVDLLVEIGNVLAAYMFFYQAYGE